MPRVPLWREREITPAVAAASGISRGCVIRGEAGRIPLGSGCLGDLY
jgi:hypothetical protein